MRCMLGRSPWLGSRLPCAASILALDRRVQIFVTIPKGSKYNIDSLLFLQNFDLHITNFNPVTYIMNKLVTQVVQYVAVLWIRIFYSINVIKILYPKEISFEFLKTH